MEIFDIWDRCGSPYSPSKTYHWQATSTHVCRVPAYLVGASFCNKNGQPRPTRYLSQVTNVMEIEWEKYMNERNQMKLMIQSRENFKIKKPKSTKQQILIYILR